MINKNKLFKKSYLSNNFQGYFDKNRSLQTKIEINYFQVT